MSRIRTIKPDFFLDDELAELTPITRLLFIGLWTLADCKGRIEDRPKKIRAQLHPFDDGDTDAMLQALHEGKFIRRYVVDEKRYLEIRTFTRHQRLTGKEAEDISAIPEPPPFTTNPHPEKREATGKQWGNNGETTGKDLSFTNVQEGKGREGKGKGMEEELAPAPNAPAPTATPSAPSAEPTPTATAATKAKAKAKERAPTHKIPLPADFAITPELQTWADEKGYGDLSQHLDSFRDKAQAKDYRYTDWSAAFRNAVRDDWAGLRKPAVTAATPRNGARYAPPPQAITPEGAKFDAILRSLNAQNHRPVIEGEIAHELH